MTPFSQRIKSFNEMYGLDRPAVPTYTPGLKDRLVQFKKILLDEISEVDDIIAELETQPMDGDHALSILTSLSDWLGDIQVYAASEMQRHGLPIDHVLDIIMDSNASKLGPDGKPIVKDGKVQKGPHYWKPEPKIQALLEALLQSHAWNKEVA